MATYKVLETSFIGDMLRQPGDLIEIDESVMSPGKNLALFSGKVKGVEAHGGVVTADDTDDLA